MTSTRPHPFELLFGEFRAERFPAIRAALGEEHDVNRFVLVAPALELLRELRPDEGLGEGVDDFVALVHAAYLFWRDGEVTVVMDEAETRRLPRPESVEGSPNPSRGPVRGSFDHLRTRYLQIAPHIIWGRLDPESSFEPLDGWFEIRFDEATLRVVACFGVHIHRPGVSVVAVQGPMPLIEHRDDAAPLFAPTMPGGDAAHLFAVNTSEELLLLSWRATRDGEV